LSPKLPCTHSRRSDRPPKLRSLLSFSQGDGRALQAALPASAQSASAASEATGIQGLLETSCVVSESNGRARLALPYGEENELMPWDAGALQGAALEEQNDECGSSAEEEGGASGRDETDDVIIEEDGKTLRLTPPKQKSALKAMHPPLDVHRTAQACPAHRMT